MKLEVEQKFPVPNTIQIENQLKELGAKLRAAEEQSDQYFAHPARNFAQTDEALRIRTVGNHSFVTYKGPKLDKTTKTRREIELPLAGTEPAAEFAELLTAIDFSPVAEVRKSRRPATVPWQDREVEVSLDDVADVGTFVELEVLADQKDVDEAKQLLQSLAEHLGLHKSERRSYLEMLLEKR